MSGTKRLIIGEITQGKAKGTALVEALGRLNSTSAAENAPKVKQKPKKGK